MPRPLHVVADLSVEAENGKRIRVEAAGTLVTVRLPDLWVARDHIGLLRDRTLRANLLHRLHQWLGISDLAVEVLVRRHRIARLAPESRAGWLARWLGLGEVEIFPLGVLRASLVR